MAYFRLQFTYDKKQHLDMLKHGCFYEKKTDSLIVCFDTDTLESATIEGTNLAEEYGTELLSVQDYVK